jgi:Fe-S-cluster-containing dehydrogenase component
MRIEIIDPDRCVGCEICMLACVRRQGFGGLAKAKIAVHSSGGMEKGFTVLVCRACPDPPCAAVCPTNALEIRKDGGVNLISKKCIGCKNCIEACTVNAIFWDSETNKPNICIYCGFCAMNCPHHVLYFNKEWGKENV